MRHDEERPQTSEFLAGDTVPGRWAQVLATMRANAFTRVTLDEIRTQAAHVLILTPSAEVARACFSALIEAFGNEAGGAGGGGAGGRAIGEAADNGAGEPAERDFVEILDIADVDPARVPAGTWVFLPHRQDGWVELETASTRVRSALVKENSTRETGARLTLIEYGVNLWMWAEPPSSGGDPVCHAGELISWESAWALSSVGSDGGPSPGAGADSGQSASRTPGVSARPPIYFGLPTLLRERRWNG